jgi:hypothetical protein
MAFIVFIHIYCTLSHIHTQHPHYPLSTALPLDPFLFQNSSALILKTFPGKSIFNKGKMAVLVNVACARCAAELLTKALFFTFGRKMVL